MKGSLSIPKIFFILFMILITLPVIQGAFKIFNVTGLYGVVDPVEKVTLSKDSWLYNTFQSYMQDQARDNIGFKPYFVRISNQINFSIFNIVNSSQVTLGKENYLFETSYIRCYTGEQNLPEDSMYRIAENLALLDKYLQEKGKKMVLIVAPSKARFYPEYLPDGTPPASDVSIYSYTTDAFAKSGLSVIDANAMLIEEKNKSPYPLVTKCGTHWSMYGSVLVADTLMKTLKNHFEEPIIGFDQGEIELTTKPQHTDSDLNLLLNLMYDIPSDTMAYAELIPSKNGRKLKVMGIGDSFYLSFLYNGLVEKCFDENSMLFYYFNSAYKGTEPIDAVAADYDLKELIDSSDVILLVSAESNSHVSYGEFSKKCVELFKETE